MQKQLTTNLESVRARIASAAQSAGRSADEIELVAVTKAVSPAIAGALVEAGQLVLAENRVDELERKTAWFAEHSPHAASALRWHLIGHLQSNKARRAVRLADVIHSIDSAKLLTAVDRIAGEEGRAPELYLQVKLVDEPAKSGLAPDELRSLVERVELEHARLVGLMAIAPLPAEDAGDEEIQRTAATVFDALAALASELPVEAFGGAAPRLSMGMSGDFETAVRSGSHAVRVGSALFAGLRNEQDRTAEAPR